MGRTHNENAAEPLTLGDLLDNRLDRLFCSCRWPGCGNTWVSLRTAFGHAHFSVRNPQGGRCTVCAAYSCPRHFALGGTNRTPVCPHCGGDLDFAPEANGRKSRQSPRLNQPVVHVTILREGPLVPTSEFVQHLLEVQSPDALEVGVTIQAFPYPNWSDNAPQIAAALVARDHREYLGSDFEMRSGEGYAQNGERWVLLKVFRKTPKYLDPTARSLN